MRYEDLEILKDCLDIIKECKNRMEHHSCDNDYDNDSVCGCEILTNASSHLIEKTFNIR